MLAILVTYMETRLLSSSLVLQMSNKEDFKDFECYDDDDTEQADGKEQSEAEEQGDELLRMVIEI